jgi:hypothetical protein
LAFAVRGEIESAAVDTTATAVGHPEQLGILERGWSIIRVPPTRGRSQHFRKPATRTPALGSALRDTTKPLVMSAHRPTRELPDKLKGRLPTVDELEAELSGGNDGTD